MGPVLLREGGAWSAGLAAVVSARVHPGALVAPPPRSAPKCAAGRARVVQPAQTADGVAQRSRSGGGFLWLVHGSLRTVVSPWLPEPRSTPSLRPRSGGAASREQAVRRSGGFLRLLHGGLRTVMSPWLPCGAQAKAHSVAARPPSHPPADWWVAAARFCRCCCCTAAAHQPKYHVPCGG